MRLRAIALAVVGVCLLIGTAGAQNQPSQEFLDEYRKGEDAYRLGNYAEATTHFEAAKALDPKLPGPWRFLGAVALAEKRYADCVAATREAIKLNPTAKTVGDTRAIHDECRAALGKPAYKDAYQPATGAVSVTTDQVGAQVTIGGLSYGATPVLKAVAVGTVDVTVKKAGYLDATRTIDVLPELVTDVDFVLEVDPNVGRDLGLGNGELTTGWVKIVTPVVGITVEVDGKSVEMDDEGRYVVEAGPHVVTVTAEGREPYSKNVRVAKGQLVSVKADLRSQGEVTSTRKRGRILVSAGVGLAVVGGVLGILGINATDTARDYWTIETNRPPFSMLPEGESDDIAPVHTREDIDALVSRGKTLGIVSNVVLVASAVAIGVGAYFLVKGRPAGDKVEVKATMVPVDHGAAAMAEVRW